MGEAEPEEALEVHRRAAVGPAEPVPFGASIVEPSMVVFHESGDGAFDHGPVLPVGGVEPVGGGLGVRAAARSRCWGCSTITRNRVAQGAR